MGSVVVAHGLYSTSSVVVVHLLSCSTACGIFPDQGSNPCPLHWRVDSQPLPPGKPRFLFLSWINWEYLEINRFHIQIQMSSVTWKIRWLHNTGLGSSNFYGAHTLQFATVVLWLIYFICLNPVAFEGLIPGLRTSFQMTFPTYSFLICFQFTSFICGHLYLILRVGTQEIRLVGIWLPTTRHQLTRKNRSPHNAACRISCWASFTPFVSKPWESWGRGFGSQGEGGYSSMEMHHHLNK